MISDLFSAFLMVCDLIAESTAGLTIGALGLVAIAAGVVYRACGVDSLEV